MLDFSINIFLQHFVSFLYSLSKYLYRFFSHAYFIYTIECSENLNRIFYVIIYVTSLSVLCSHQDIKEATTKRQTKTKQLNLHFQEKLPLHFDHASSNIVNIIVMKKKYKSSWKFDINCHGKQANPYSIHRLNCECLVFF